MSGEPAMKRRKTSFLCSIICEKFEELCDNPCEELAGKLIEFITTEPDLYGCGRRFASMELKYLREYGMKLNNGAMLTIRPNSFSIRKETPCVTPADRQTLCISSILQEQRIPFDNNDSDAVKIEKIHELQHLGQCANSMKTNIDFSRVRMCHSVTYDPVRLRDEDKRITDMRCIKVATHCQYCEACWMSKRCSMYANPTPEVIYEF